MTTAMVSLKQLKLRLITLSGPAAGALALAMMLGKGRVFAFFVDWMLMFIFFAAVTYVLAWVDRMATSRAAKFWNFSLLDDSPQGRFFFLLLSVPVLLIVSNMFEFRMLKWVGLVILIMLIGLSVPIWKLLYHRWPTRRMWPQIVLSGLGACLVGVLVIASFLLRAGNLHTGLPYIYYWDEPNILAFALRMFRDGDMNPHLFVYPSFAMYLQFAWAHVTYAILKIAGWIHSKQDILTGVDHPNPEWYYWTISHSLFWYMGRLLHSLLSCASLLLIFSIARKLKGYWAGVFAVGFLAFNALYIEHSAYTTVDAVTAFCCCLWAYCFVQAGAAELPARKRTLLYVTAFMAGVTISTKYNALPIIFPTLLTPWWDPTVVQGRSFKEVFLTAGIISVIGFFAATPYAMFDFRIFVNGLIMQFQYYAVSGDNYNEARNFRKMFGDNYRFLKDSLGYGGWGPLAFCVSIPLSIIGDKFTKGTRTYFALILLFPVLYLLWMSDMVICYNRNLMVVIPFIALSMGYWLAEIQRLLCTPVDQRFFNRQPVASHVLGAALCMFLFFKNTENAFATFKGFRLYGDDSRSVVLRKVKKELADKHMTGPVWIVQESKIHTEEVRGVENEFRFIAAEEALEELKKSPPLMIVTTDLIGYSPDILAANQKLIHSGTLVETEGDGPVKKNILVGNPRVYVIRPDHVRTF